MLATTIEDDWEPNIQEQWRLNQSGVRGDLMHQFGVQNHEQKSQNFTDLGAAPWSVVAVHNVYLSQVRAALSARTITPHCLARAA